MTSGHIYRQTTTSHSIMSKPCAVFRNRACVLVVAHPKKGQSTLFRHQSESRQVSPDPRGKCASPTDDLKPGSEPISNEMMVSLGLVLLNPQTAFRGLSEPRDNSFRKSPTASTSVDATTQRHLHCHSRPLHPFSTICLKPGQYLLLNGGICRQARLRFRDYVAGFWHRALFSVQCDGHNPTTGTCLLKARHTGCLGSLRHSKTSQFKCNLSLLLSFPQR